MSKVRLEQLSIVRYSLGNDEEISTYTGHTLEECFKRACKELYEYEVELFNELGITSPYPSNSVDFIKDKGNIYQDYFNKLVGDLKDLSVYYTHTEHYIDLIIKDDMVIEVL